LSDVTNDKLDGMAQATLEPSDDKQPAIDVTFAPILQKDQVPLFSSA